MKALGLIFAVIAAVSVYAIEPSTIYGCYKPGETGSRMELSSTGSFALESTGEVPVWLLSGQWKIDGDVVVLAWSDEIARYAILNEGTLLVLVSKSKGAKSIERPDVVLASKYKKEPNQSSQRNAMARPFSVFESRSSRG